MIAVKQVPDAAPVTASWHPPVLPGNRAPEGVVVLGGDYRGLGVVRSLGRHGVPVWVLTDQHLIAGTSRYARRKLPWPTHGEAEQVAFLMNLAELRQLRGWVLFPTSDEAAALLARHHAVLSERFLLTIPPWEILRWAHDKRLTYELAEGAGVDCPGTFYPADRAAVAALDCQFPVILKPAAKEEFNPFTHAKAWEVGSRAELLARYDEACAFMAPELIMVQELIPGGGETQFSFAALCQDGEPCASVVARRTRQYPLDFGRASTFVETVERPEIEEPARRLLLAMRHSGLAEVEFKRDPRDGRFKLLDVNPRIWGWHTLGERAGVDFSYLVWQWVQGQPIAPVRGRAGERWVRLVTDMPAALQSIRQGKLSLGSYLWSLRPPLECAIFAADDPLPGLADAPLLAYLATKRGAL